MRRLALIAVLLGCALSACGGDDASAPPTGSASNPLPAQPADPPSGESVVAGPTGRAETTQPSEPQVGGEPPKAGEPGYQALVDRQTSKPQERFTPCNLVSPAQARAIVGTPMRAPVEAPQGPTCIYRSRSGHRFVSLAVQAADVSRLKRQMDELRAVDVSDRTAYCGTRGQEMLVLPLSGSRVLSVSAPCELAQQFAAKAVRQLAA